MADRHQYRVALSGPPSSTDPDVRVLSAADRERLPPLMLAAYAGTTDDEGESLDEAVEEIEEWLEHGGRLDRSFGYERDETLLSAALVTVAPKGAILAYVITHPSAKREGHGRRVVDAALERLRQDGHREVHLWITEGNVPSEALFAGLAAERITD